MRLIFKYSNLVAGIIALVSVAMIFILFINVNFDLNKRNRVYFTLKPERASWAWLA